MGLTASAGLVLLTAAGCATQAADVTVSDTATLRQAIGAATPGTRILVSPGQYQGGMYFEGLSGTREAPITIAALDPERPPGITAGPAAFHFADAAHLELRDLVLTGGTGNGLNMDDGGSFDTPAHDIKLVGLQVRDVGPQGNCDGIKLSGVTRFRVEDCVIERWGAGGSAIDMVGCHEGTIEGCVFRARSDQDGNAVQTKGGSTRILVTGNRFEHAGSRAVNIGGSTGLQYFRPQPTGYEAQDITVERNLFVGSQAPIAFVGVDGATVRLNTIYLPGRWALRILQETREPGFVPCRGGVFEDNIVVFRSDRWAEGGVNIGPDTAPESFRFARNLWYCMDRPELSGPRLPTPEVDGVVGPDPLFVDPERGDFGLQPGSPAEGKGHTAAPQL